MELVVVGVIVLAAAGYSLRSAWPMLQALRVSPPAAASQRASPCAQCSAKAGCPQRSR